MRIAILGSNSFSGLNLIGHLLSQSQFVVGISRSSEAKFPFNLNEKTKSERNFRFYQIDMNHDPKLVSDVLVKENIEYIVNFAAQSMVPQSWDYPEDWYRTNLESFAIFLNYLIASRLKIKKFIQFTTPEVYGSTLAWIKESFSFAPSTPYAVSRAASDWHLLNLYKRGQIPAVFTRAANVYGEGQQLYRIVPKTALCVLSNQILSLHGGGKSIRSFIHIDDVSSALMKILESGRVGESYHISTKDSVSISDLVELVFSLMGQTNSSLINTTEELPGKDSLYLLDSQKIREELGWSDKIPLSEGVSRTINWVSDNIEVLRKLPSNYVHKRSM